MSQTSGYGFELTKAQAGQKYDLRPDTVESFAAESALAFGSGVIQGTNDNQVDVAVAGGTFMGVAMLDPVIEQDLDGGDTEIPADRPANVLRKGTIWVVANATVAVNDDAYIDVDDDVDRFTNVAGTDNIDTTGQFRTAGDQGDLVVLEIDL